MCSSIIARHLVVTGGDITETVLLSKLAIYKLPLAESKATPLGVLPTGIVPITLLFWPDIAVTVLSPELVTSRLPFLESDDMKFNKQLKISQTN
jgi:hypothetical protein